MQATGCASTTTATASNALRAVQRANIVIFFIYLAHDLLFGNLVHRDGIRAIYGWIKANSDGIYFFDVS